MLPVKVPFHACLAFLEAQKYCCLKPKQKSIGESTSCNPTKVNNIRLWLFYQFRTFH